MSHLTSILTGLLITALAAGPSTTSITIQSVDDVIELVRSGAEVSDVCEAIRAAGVYLPMQPRRAVELYFDGIPVEVVASMLATGGVWPRVAERGRELDLVYEAYRIVGRLGPSGPELLLSGFDGAGERMQEPVPPPAIEQARAESRQHAHQEPIADQPLWRPTYPAPVSAPPARSMAISSAGAPAAVTVTQVPAGSITRATVTVPFGVPSAFPSETGFASYGFTSYGLTNPYGVYGRGAGCLAPASGFVSYELESSRVGRRERGRAAPRVVRQRVRR